MKTKTRKTMISCFAVASIVCGMLALTNVEATVSAGAETPIIALRDGASCRIKFDETAQANTGGIRFSAVLDQAQWQDLLTENDSAEISAGVIVVPTDYVTEAGGYTHEKLLALAQTHSLQIADFSYTAEEIGTETELAGSVINILGKNYTRDFSGVAYLKSNEEIDGWESYDGEWYYYAAYDEAKNVRNVYEVAYNAYNDRTDSETTVGAKKYNNRVTFNDTTSYSPYSSAQRDILKGYLDGVADVAKNDDGDIVAMNNTSYYTSPYAPKEVSTDNWLIENGNGVKAMLYGGEWSQSNGIWSSSGVRKTAFNVTDDGVKVHTLVKSETATVNGTDVTLIGDQVGTSATLESMAKLTLDYVAFNGNYEIGTYIDFFFTGNNMPQVCLFADKINGDVTKGGGTGLIAFNGLMLVAGGADDGSDQTLRMDQWIVFGPNRIQREYSNSVDNFQTMMKSTNDSTNYPGSFPLMSQTGLSGTPDTKYQYTLGSFEGSDGYLYLDIYLINADTNETIYHLNRRTQLIVDTMEMPAFGNIIAYAGVKGNASTTSFTYSLPYESNVVYNGATFNDDGTVSLTGRQSGGSVDLDTLTKHDNSYVAFKGSYGLGTYVDFWFTGNNLPQVMFFADQINGNITSYGGTGVLLMNGMVKTSEYSLRMDQLCVFGPNRISSSKSGYDGDFVTVFNHVSYDDKAYPLLTQSGLAENPNAKYKYTVGIHEGADGCIYVEIYLYNADTNQEIYHVDRKVKDNTLTVDNLTAGNIVAYAGYKGSGSTTTFKYSQPYTK